MDRLSELLGHHVQFSYTAWDRIVLNGYLDRLQRPENIVYFFRDVVGAPSVTPEVLMSRTAPYRAWVARYAEEQGIPLRAGAERRAQGRARRPVLPAVQAAEGVVAILSSTEQGRTFVSYTPRYPPPSGDPHYRLIERLSEAVPALLLLSAGTRSWGR